jgi:hypothetical protein
VVGKIVVGGDEVVVPGVVVVVDDVPPFQHQLTCEMAFCVGGDSLPESPPGYVNVLLPALISQAPTAGSDNQNTVLVSRS